MDTIPAVLAGRLRVALSGIGEIEPVVTPATDARFGDYQTNAAMLLAKQLRGNPRQIAQQIIAKLDVGRDFARRRRSRGAGFINFRVTAGCLEERVITMAGMDARGAAGGAGAERGD